DVMRSEQETVVNQLFTRFALVADDAGPPRVNAYNTFKNSADIGLRDDNRNKIPDFAYVTGTGANDVIKLTDGGTDAAGRRKVVVTVQAFRFFDHTGKPIRTDTYTIVVGVDTEGPIRIDGGAGDDLVTVAQTLKVDTVVYGGEDDDTIETAGGKD